jgi:hypothetical protein
MSEHGRPAAKPKNRVAVGRLGRLYRAEGPDLPQSLSSLWETTGNPYWVWEQIAICSNTGVDFPDWVRIYLAQCAERMTSPDALRERDLRKMLPKILGFPKNSHGAGHLLDPGGMHDPRWIEYAKVAMEFKRVIQRPWVTTAYALKEARKDGHQKLLGDVGDRTLLRHIKEILGVTGNPRTNAEWRTALRHWL